MRQPIMFPSSRSLTSAMLLFFLCCSSSIVSLTTASTSRDTSQLVEPCDHGVVQVTNLTVQCDSPYTFYYGNGAHRHSPVCDYGDKATLAIEFDLTDSLDEPQIYMSLSAYNDADEQLYATSTPVDLCATYFSSSSKYSCGIAGSYSFHTRIQFAYIDGEQSQFVPRFEIAFSAENSGGFDMGAVNIYCDDKDSSYFIDWQKIRSNSTNYIATETFVQEWTVLIVTLLSMCVLCTCLFRANANNLDEERALLDTTF